MVERLIPAPKMPINELIALKSLENQDVGLIFGVDKKPGVKFADFPPHVQSYYVVGSAMSDQELGQWGRYGAVAGQRKPEFEDFQAITVGLDVGEKIRFCVILWKYLGDLSSSRPGFMGGETVAQAARWVRDLLASVDLGIAIEASRLGIDELNKLLLTMPSEDAPVVAAAVQNSVREEVAENSSDGVERAMFAVKNWLGRLAEMLPKF